MSDWRKAAHRGEQRSEVMAKMGQPERQQREMSGVHECTFVEHFA